MRLLSHYEPHNIFEEVLDGLQDFLRGSGMDVIRCGSRPNIYLTLGDSKWTCSVHDDGIRVYWYSDVVIFPFEDPEQFEKVHTFLAELEK